MSEELIQRNLIEAPEKMGDWNFYNIGATTLKALKGAKIIPDRDYEEYEGKKPDALIVKKPIVIAAIEYKTPQELRTEKQVAKAIAQEIGTAQVLQAKVYIVTDGKKSFWINPLTGAEVLQEDGSKISLNFDKNSTECITLINKIRAFFSIGSVLNFVSILFQLIPETGCGQSPQSIINTEQFLNMPWCNQGKIKSQRHKTNYTLHLLV